MHLLRTIFSGGLIHIWCSSEYFLFTSDAVKMQTRMCKREFQFLSLVPVAPGTNWLVFQVEWRNTGVVGGSLLMVRQQCCIKFSRKRRISRFWNITVLCKVR